MALGFYRKLNRKLISLLRIERFNDKQIDALATKMDIFGAFLVTQAWFGLTIYGWNVWIWLVVFLFSLLFCAILWTLAFDLKGYIK
ncbi:hypothetical protein [Stenoxybacter acetivorans]|uniref:hypothetical protein n=1 Tax=Stenoxybacter acetivorans TaxID=422441 RepID=UPI000566C002|nr:hypothetical protein [Stenoxybacter acetivorans]